MPNFAKAAVTATALEAILVPQLVQSLQQVPLCDNFVTPRADLVKKGNRYFYYAN